ncbi:AAA family ATPase, partial [Streptomyces sp. SID6648]|nr:AAA family ATPase [Streptomyces sp. SID6648]
ERLHQGKRVAPEYQLSAGDVIVIDEAGMAGSKRIAAVVAEAQEAGALVRLIGDPFQLAAVESGGALRL